MAVRVTRPAFLAGIKALKAKQGLKDYDANRDATITAVGFAGNGSGFVSLGAAVAVVTDNGDAIAALGADITDSGTTQPSSAGDG